MVAVRVTLYVLAGVVVVGALGLAPPRVLCAPPPQPTSSMSTQPTSSKSITRRRGAEPANTTPAKMLLSDHHQLDRSGAPCRNAALATGAAAGSVADRTGALIWKFTLAGTPTNCMVAGWN